MEYLTTDKEGIKILIEVLKEKGIRQVVLSPGSRNAPLLVAFAREKQSGTLSCSTNGVPLLWLWVWRNNRVFRWLWYARRGLLL